MGTSRLLKTGQAVCTQDLGREGFKHLGITQSGAADRHAYCWANHILGNKPGDVAIEIFLGNLTLDFSSASQICVTGAECRAFLNGKPMPLWQAVSVSAGDILDLHFPSRGVYSYLAIKGGFIVDQILGSCAISLREKIGPNHGDALKKGTLLSFQPTQHRHSPTLSLRRGLPNATPYRFRPDYSHEMSIPVIPCYHYDYFSQTQKNIFFDTAFTIHNESNKMGVRMTHSSHCMHLKIPNTFESEGSVLGSIQVLPNGEPIVLMSEHPTMGGYPKIGVIGRLACYQLAQRRPGQSVRFVLSTREQEQIRLAQFNTFFTIKGIAMQH